MSSDQSLDERKWDVTWLDSSRAQLAEALSATPAQRLAWLEEAIEFAYRARRSTDADRSREAMSPPPALG